ncbi:MAG: family N-acetyltransferase [Chloroflexi bacterium]|nr:family N-acetyltransferase [Chloroflexota bacterium]
MVARGALQRKQEIDRVERFLERDSLLNFHITSTLLHERAEVVGLAESGEAVVGAAIATPSASGKPSLLRFDAIGPVALQRLLASLRERPARLMLHRPWQGAVIEREIGPLEVRSVVEMFSAGPHAFTALADPRVRELTPADVARALEQAPSWILELLRDHLARGWHAFGAYVDGSLAAHVCCGYRTETSEEICHLYTTPEQRGRGLATAVVGVAARAIVARGHQPVYFSRSVNKASQRVALCSGFHRVSSLQEVAV